MNNELTPKVPLSCIVNPDLYFDIEPNLNIGFLKEHEQLINAKIKDTIERREEILTAFVAKFGIHPEKIVEVIQRFDDGTEHIFFAEQGKLICELCNKNITAEHRENYYENGNYDGLHRGFKLAIRLIKTIILNDEGQENYNLEWDARTLIDAIDSQCKIQEGKI